MNGSSMPTWLQAEGLVAGYRRDIQILQGLTVHASPGAITAVLGPNGVGKSTLLKVVAGFLRPAAGRVVLRGVEITGLPPHRIKALGVSYLMQRPHLFPRLSVEDNLQLGGWLDRARPAAVQARIASAFERFPVLGARRRLPAGLLSGGEQRMLELARALMTDPAVLLVDEPTTGLAPAVSAEVYAHLLALRQEGRAILLVDQNIRAALSVADYVYVVELGQNRAHGPRAAFSGDLAGLVRSWIV